ncbi:hypothetical protein HNQ60_001910 [Povalibacter uvarum]|uniref:Putative Flp pilus-assembly TadG-like N-terminal domain-containing protein n=1 Tax=Povalibacter uvarum TaxID=732238 RepID=A0A841HLR3_9GAMM|nr:pilus assembly protein TadG-related protein [Povalibacter uvarum]MBB6093032.1 hypothetical protein [Povalibacter uvarum]
MADPRTSGTSFRERHPQLGQIAPVALFGVLIASAVLVLMYNTAQKVTEKSQVANAADAAAYSGAVWTARHLNFMAYTNRAMVANHAAVGHLVSYVSWIRYIHESIQHVDRITRYIPYVGQYVSTVEEVAEEVREITEQGAQVLVPAIDGWNTHFRAAQVEVQASLALNNLNDLMEQTARRWDPDVRINDRDAIGAMPDALRRVIEAQVLMQLVNVPTFVERYTASNDSGAVNQLITTSFAANADLRRWISGERGWRENLVAAQIRKQGSTSTSQSEDGADWQARDQLQYRTLGVFGWRSWRRVGDRVSTARASEFDSDYQGVPSYYNVAGRPSAAVLSIGALATKEQSRVATHDKFGLATNESPLAVAAMAEVSFRRPTGSAFAALGSNRREHANLFNPFWDARLVPIESGIGL